MKLAIVGSRTFRNYQKMHGEIAALVESGDMAAPTEIVSGGAAGADSLGREYAVEMGLEYTEFPADWDVCATDCPKGHRRARTGGGSYCPTAGFRRNAQIVDCADKVIAFWDGVSRGTKHTIGLAEKAGKLIKVVE